MARRPPAPNERPVSLATGGAPTLPPPAAPASRRTWRSEDVGVAIFLLLVVLGLLAASRAFLLLGS